MKLAVYAHPDDLDALPDHGGLARLADLGIDEVALATGYHAGRWLTPWHTGARVRFLEDGVVHFRPGFDYGALRPEPSRSVPASGPSPLEKLCEDAARAQIRVRAWNVFTHNSRLGAMHPEFCVENAFGDRYRYALCPSQPAVQRYVLGLLRDLGSHAGLATVELEAIGWLGWKHGSHHDKASLQPRGWLDLALSLCFCPACEGVAKVAGGSLAEAREWARGAIRDAIELGDAMAPVEPEPPGDVISLVGASRIATMHELGRRVRAEVRPGLGLAL
ncbi:MAG: hypothetical protein KDC98_11155, partial [Planctomycetes bacterium]|nr:hypothetical protein [Planctomycetota bacterium]